MSKSQIAIFIVILLCYTKNVFAYQSSDDNPLIRDGDSIKMEIRLYGIDTPELYQKCLINGKCVQCGKLAKQYLNALTYNKLISCTAKVKDKYGRFVSQCFADGKDIAKEMVKAGWAVIDERFSKEYLSEQVEAKKLRKGLWRGKFIKPWEWRKSKKEICK